MSDPNHFKSHEKSQNWESHSFFVREGFRKVKAMASTRMKKMKEGTTVRFQWIKDKYHKTTQKRYTYKCVDDRDTDLYLCPC
ncbi:hypothetical protein ACSBR2_023261 [Camellia fascicularis]